MGRHYRSLLHGNGGNSWNTTEIGTLYRHSIDGSEARFAPAEFFELYGISEQRFTFYY